MLLYLEIMGRVVRYTVSSCRPLLAPIFSSLTAMIIMNPEWLDQSRKNIDIWLSRL